MRVTAAMLRDHGACPAAVDVFVEAWPSGCEVDADVVRRAAELGLSIPWAVDHLLTSPSARVAFEHGLAVAQREFGLARQHAENTYHDPEARRAAGAAASLARRDDAIQQAQRAYEEAMHAVVVDAFGVQAEEAEAQP
jgi:hypothetical protein